MSSYQDELQRTLRRLHDRDLANTTVRVLEPTVDYEPGAGPTVRHSDVGAVDARLEVPSRSTSQDEGGITESVDATLRVRDDAEVPQDSADGGLGTAQFSGFTYAGGGEVVRWVGYGDGAGAAAHVIDAETGDRYEIRSKTREQNGLLRLEAELVDDA